MKNDTKIGKQFLRLTLGLLVIWTTSAQAAEVFGLTFGQPLPLPECEKRSSYYALPVNRTCFEKKSLLLDHTDTYINFPRGQDPQIVRRRLSCMVIDGNLELMQFETNGNSDKETVLTALTTKFGTPSSIERPVVQNAMGARYEDVTAIWTLPNLYVQFRGLDGSTDNGSVAILTPKGRAEYNRRNKPRDDPRPL